jgi:anti-sigma regulatory factor (Ser/Thr protein kinase)
MNRARSAAAQLLDPSTSVLPVAPAARPERIARQEWPEDELASMYAGIALRDLNLVDSLLAKLESMEAHEADPEALARLYRLDHLATRLRRNAENLRILAGQEAGSVATDPCSLVDVLRAAMSSIEQYTRVEIGRVAALAVVDFAADDVSRLLAELLDNATAQSPPTSVVTVSAHLTEQGSVLVRVEDAGIGLPPERLRALNTRLTTNRRLDGESIEHMGLAVVRRLASKHGIRVTLEKRATHGTTASVLLPSALLCEAPPTPWFTEVAAPETRSRTAALARPATPSTAPLPSRKPGPKHAQTETPARSVAAKPAAPESPAPGSKTAEAGAPESKTPEAGTPESKAAGSTSGEPTTASEPTTTTKNGLPKRVPHSLRGSSGSSSAPSAAEPATDKAARAGREQFVADLGAFSDGEQAARSEAPTETPAEGSSR